MYLPNWLLECFGKKSTAVGLNNTGYSCCQQARQEYLTAFI